MRLHRWLRCGLAAGACAMALFSAARGSAQVFINEVVKEERTTGAGAISPDVREFLELYNSGATPVDISNWSIVTTNLANGTPINDVLPSGASIPAGGYYVIAVAGRTVANADHYITIGATEELYPDLTGSVIELKDSSSALVDAVGYDIFRGTNTVTPTPEQETQIGGGYWGQYQSYSSTGPQSLARYRDGRDSNVTGRDFGILPATPGASNNLPLNPLHTVPNVDAAGTGSIVNDYNFSFIAARTIDPATASSFNPKAIPASPQGGKAIVAWDESGGGNAAYSKELVNSFDIYAYIDANPIGLAATTNDQEWDSTGYGIGTVDGLYGNPDPTGALGLTTSQNSSSGIGWILQRYEDTEQQYTKLMLIDFGKGGNGIPTAGNWDIIQTIDLASTDTGWHRLGVSYDPATGAAVGTFGDQTFQFTTETDLLGTFYAGYREAITGSVASQLALHAPPIFDLYEAAAPVEDADFNNDNIVDGADFLIWQRNLGMAGGLDKGDADGNGQIQAADLAIWKAKFGTVGASAAAAAVPEPAASLLVVVSLSALGVFRRCTKTQVA